MPRWRSMIVHRCSPLEGMDMESTGHIDFNAPAVLRKWPSVNGRRLQSVSGATSYLIFEGSLDQCIHWFVAKPASQRHLYEIETLPQGSTIGHVMIAPEIEEIVRLRDFL